MDFVGMQVHAHDLKDEGVETVLNNMMEKAGVGSVLPTANYVEERQPLTPGQLPHNPKRGTYVTMGGLYFKPDPAFYRACKIKPLRTGEDLVADLDVVKTVVQSAKENEMRVYPWVQCFEDELIGRKHPQHLRVDVHGKRDTTGLLCPNDSEVRKYISSIVKDLATSHDIDGIFLDRFRYSRPDEHMVFSCFCTNCAKKARENGYNMKSMKEAVVRIERLLHSLTAEHLRDWLSDRIGNFDLLKLFVRDSALLDWLRFRIDTITEFVAEVHRLLKEIDPKLEVGLDTQPPSYSWLLGQDYKELRNCCDWVKPITYPKLRGNMIVNILRKFESLDLSQVENDCLNLVYDLLGITGPNSLNGLRNGLPSEYTYFEILRARRELATKVPVYAGIQLWNASAEEVRSQIEAAKRAGANGFIYYCYGWAPFENFEVAKEEVGQ